MLKVANKQVIAIGITPRINEYERDRIQEFLDGIHLMSPARKTYDTGTKKKTVLDQSPMGPAETGGPGDRLSHDNVGSGYNKGVDPAGQADDETGPGNTSKSDKEQTFTSHDTADLAFKNDSDTSSTWSPLNYESNKRDQNSTNHLRLLHRQPKNKVPVRYPVDEMNRAASTWTYVYV